MAANAETLTSWTTRRTLSRRCVQRCGARSRLVRRPVVAPSMTPAAIFATASWCLFVVYVYVYTYIDSAHVFLRSSTTHKTIHTFLYPTSDFNGIDILGGGQSQMTNPSEPSQA